MKRILALFFLTTAGLFAQSETVDLGSHGRLTLYHEDGWKVEVADYGDRRLLTLTPKGEVNATCTLTITFPGQDHFPTKAKLRLQVEADSEKFAEGSVEGKAVAHEFAVRTGFGWYCSFTDPDLVGKPPEPGNYKVISGGLVHVAPDVLVEVAISADGFKSEAYQQLLGVVEGMDFDPPAGGKI